jgi:hypothetical protein
MKKSMAADVVLSVVPVDTSTMELVGTPWSVPLCTPPALPVEKVAVAVVILVADGIVPVALTTTEANRFAPLPEAKPFVQFTMSLKFSV